MMKTIRILLFAFLVAFVFSCSEDKMDEINFNLNDPANASSSLQLTDAMVNTAFNIIGSDFSFYSSVYMELQTGIFGQMYNADIRTGEPTNSSTYNNPWGSTYQNLYNLSVIIEKCSTGGEEEGNTLNLGIAQILTAYNWAVLTDLMGDIPFEEALNPGVTFTPTLDSQDEIYDEIFSLLNEGITNVNASSDFENLGVQDVLYEGGADLWTKFAYGLLARYSMFYPFGSIDYQQAIDYADLSFTSADEECKYEYNGSTSVSPFYQFFDDRDYFGASESLNNKLQERNDPRADVYFKVHPEADDQDNLLFAPNGNSTQIQELYSISALSSLTAPTFLMSYHELLFIKAEAAQRLGNADAATYLQDAISAAFQKANVDLSETDASDYYTNDVEALFTADALSEIIHQKYLACFEEEALVAYNDYRRLLGLGEEYIELENDLNDSGEFPLRFTYGADDVTNNVNIRDAFGDGTYVYSDPVRWAGGDN